MTVTRVIRANAARASPLPHLIFTLPPNPTHFLPNNQNAEEHKEEEGEGGRLFGNDI